MKGDTGVRQLGFQETEIVPMVAPITKHAVQLRDKTRIRYELEKAVHIARSGRPGPVVVDIPDDLQRESVDAATLPGFAPPAAPATPAPQADQIAAILELAAAAERPVLVLGWGVRQAGAAAAVGPLIDRLGFPVLTSWGARDMVPSDHPLLAGTFGTHGTRAGNFTVQNADLVIAVGARLSTRETGSPLSSWAREARLVAVDVDPAELAKFARFGKPADVAVNADAGAFVAALLARAANFRRGDLTAWTARVAGWRRDYPAGGRPADPPLAGDGAVEPYAMVDALAAALPPTEHVFIDTGCAIAWMMQRFAVRSGQRLFHDFNNTAMGWALPAAIGGSFALGGAPVTCVVGDGSLMMNVQELATLQRHRLPVRVFVLDNGGYSMVQQTEEQWLGGRHVGTSYDGGLAFPDFAKLAAAFEIPSLTASRADAVADAIDRALRVPGPVLVDIRIPGSARVVPQSRFGYPIEDSEPLLPREEFLRNMIVKPLAKSLESPS
jgi:acetolactate synthase-1/2/3 large subunit